MGENHLAHHKCPLKQKGNRSSLQVRRQIFTYDTEQVLLKLGQATQDTDQFEQKPMSASCRSIFPMSKNFRV